MENPNFDIPDSDEDDDEITLKAQELDTVASNPLRQQEAGWKNLLLEDGFDLGLVDVQYRVERGAESYVAPGHERPQINGQASAFDSNVKLPLVSLGHHSDSRASNPKTILEESNIFEEIYDFRDLETFGINQGYNGERMNNYVRRQAFFMGGRWRSCNITGSFEKSRKPFMKRKFEQVALQDLISPNYCLESLMKVTLDPKMDLSSLANEIAHHLGERNPDTIRDIVLAIGGEKACEIFERTKETENNGGLRTYDGTRRRAPGGVFIYLFRDDPSISDEVKKTVLPNFQQRVFAHPSRNRSVDLCQEIGSVEMLANDSSK